MSQTAASYVSKYNMVARIFHWVGVALIVAAVVIINQGEEFISLHKSVGFSFLIWTVLRLINRFVSAAPSPVAMSKLQHGLSVAVHGLLYVAMLAMPLTGLLASMAFGYGVNVFGVLPIAGFATPNDELGSMMMNLHKNLIWPALLALVAAHILAALYHQFVMKDKLLSRML